MNKVVLIGRLTRDPELKFIPSTGTAVTTFTLAVDRAMKKEGQQEADFINCVAFGKRAETIVTYLNKGRLIAVSGSIRTGSYDAKDGTKRYTFDISVDEFKFLEKSQGGGNTVSRPYQQMDDNNYGQPSAASEDDMTPIDDDDIPF